MPQDRKCPRIEKNMDKWLATSGPLLGQCPLGPNFGTAYHCHNGMLPN